MAIHTVWPQAVVQQATSRYLHAHRPSKNLQQRYGSVTYWFRLDYRQRLVYCENRRTLYD